MSAEELDKLFKNRLENRSVAPSEHAWARLQSQMQAQAPEQEKRPVMWYYSAAAAVTLLLSVGVYTVTQQNGGLPASGTVAAVKTQSAPLATSAADQGLNTIEAPLKNNSTPQATETFAAASTNQTEYVARVSPTQPARTVAYPATASKKPGQTAPAGASSQDNLSSGTQGQLAMNNVPAESRSAAEENAPLEIIVKLSDASPTEALALAEPVAEEPADQEKGSTRVLKGILKQVKNLRDGEKINREELGIPKHTFALETRIGNRTISKTIEL